MRRWGDGHRALCALLGCWFGFLATLDVTLAAVRLGVIHWQPGGDLYALRPSNARIPASLNLAAILAQLATLFLVLHIRRSAND
jgi:hypothetical protein